MIVQVVPTYSAGPLHEEREPMCAHISKDLQDQVFIDGGILLLAVLSLQKSLWLQERRAVKTVQELGGFWVFLESY